jgi:hypothetical protein
MRCVSLAVFFLLLASVGVADVLWDNGALDGRAAFASYRELGFGNPTDWTADDFIVDQPWVIKEVTAQFALFVQGIPRFPPRFPKLADISIWEQPSPGAKPGRKVVLLQNLPMEWEQIGEWEGGYPIINLRVRNLDIRLVPGNYYFSVAPVAGTDGDAAYFCTAGNGAIKGTSGGWLWYWHWNNWGRVSTWLSTRFWLSTSDFAFKLEGEKQ